MKLYSHNIHNGYLDICCGNNSLDATDIINGINVHSFHLAWEDLPPNTKSLALIFDDPDAIPVCGFSWIHWTVCNIDPATKELKENESITNNSLIQGRTSWSSKLLGHECEKDFMSYGGCAPPDKTHTYRVTVYALDTILDLNKGFYCNELIHAMEGHVIDSCTLNMKYDQVK